MTKILGSSFPRYSEESKRWLDSNGRFTTEAKAMEEMEEIKGAYSGRIKYNIHPNSDKIEQLIGISAAIEDARIMQNLRPQPIPSDIYTAMLLSEYFVDTEGDLFQTIAAPMEIGIKPLVVSCEDKGIEKESKEIIKRTYLNDICQDIFFCTEVYGQAYPLEKWEKNSLYSIHLIDPKLIWCNRSNLWATNDESLIEQLSNILEEYQYHGVVDDNSASPSGIFNISGEVMRPVYARKQAWRVYATPPLRRSFRTLSSRQVLDEMVRATVEGYKNQLWVFKIGSKERRATPHEILYLKDQIEGGSGDRTGHLVWNYDLTVEQHAPSSLDQMLGGDKWEQYTQKLFTERGISIRMVSGNSPNNQDRNIEIDIQVLVERLKQRRIAIESWVSYIFNKIAIKNNWNVTPIVKLDRISLEDEAVIKNRIQPLYTIGLLSSKTALENAGYDYATEVANKKSENKTLFTPPATFAQTVVNQEPQSASEKKVLENDTGFDKMGNNDGDSLVFASNENEDKINEEWDKVKRGELDPRIFIEWMIALMQDVGEESYMMGMAYGEAGKRYEMAKTFNIPYLNNLKEDISKMNIEDYGKLDNRISMYLREGQKHAYMWGVQDNMERMGYIGWRRVLHPELSKTGPCKECIEDSLIIHRIEEDWFDHPGGVCSQQGVVFYPADIKLAPHFIEIPNIKTFVRKAA